MSTLEHDHGVTERPADTCPLIDEAKDKVQECLDTLQSIQNEPFKYTRGLIEDAIDLLKPLVDPKYKDGVVEDIRDRVIEIREWGEQWKLAAIKYHEKLEELQEGGAA